MTAKRPETLNAAARNSDGTYDGAKALSWLSDVLFPGRGVPEEDVKKMWQDAKARKTEGDGDAV